ncbi:MAG: hypothetical protein ACYS7Y_12050 [Planctomycetota bacterium]
MMDVHKGVSCLYFHKFGMNPHIMESEMAGYYNPVRLAALWLETVNKLLFDGPIVINSSGGCLMLDEVKVIAEQQSDKLVWPEYNKDEIITISRWPEGRHFYLSSNMNRVFVPPKYTRYRTAMAVARTHTNNIKSKGC